MKIIYCTHSLYNPGGMERVLYNKVCYLVNRMHWDITVVTTDQQQRPTFYPFPVGVRMVDLDINYSVDNTKGVLGKCVGYLRRRKIHRRRLTELLMRERADIVVSLYPSESSFLPMIKDGSRKVLELHFCKFFRLQYGRSGLMGILDRLRTRQDVGIVRRFDKFVVLTNEDRGYWGELPNITVIPNAAKFIGNHPADSRARRVIAVGRLDYQKGFDRLIRAWQRVWKHKDLHAWRLDIFGQGEWRDMLQQQIDAAGLHDCAQVNAPTTNIGKVYAESSLLAMSSHYEGFPMVMIEAMACGLPVVTFDFKCGPKDIIRHGVNGLLVHEGDTDALADALAELMRDDERRRRMAQEARKVTETYSEERVMEQWIELFNELMGK